MTKGLQQIQFLCFAIICKRMYLNSVLIGSPHLISKKIGISDYQTRKFINYGLKNGLISKNNGYFSIAKYDLILESIEAVKIKKQFTFYKEGNFSELVEKNLFAIASINFNQQLFKIKKAETLKIIKYKLATGFKGITRKEYNFYNKNKSCVQGENFIITGQKALCKLLKVSQGYSSYLLTKWAKIGLIFRTIQYSKYFDPNNSVVLRLDNNMICLGSKIVIIP